MTRIQRALISTSNKTDLLPLANTLISHGVEILSTGGTADFLRTHQIPVTSIETFTGYPEAFDGRVKTLGFPVLAALLFDRERHGEEAKKLSVKPIDLLVCNFYPFEERVRSISFEESIEYIDVGGPTMVRAAAKNYQSVSVLTSPDSYSAFIQEFNDANGSVSLQTRQQLMVKAFNHIADYDASIAMAMSQGLGEKTLRLHFKQGKDLRYGENAHQEATFYREAYCSQSLHDSIQHQGKPLSYNNLIDMQVAAEVVDSLEDYGVCVIKHNTPCGLAQSHEQKTALELAWEGDPLSAFGSVIAFNQVVTKDTLMFFNLHDKQSRKFVEVLIAPGFTQEALDYCAHSKNLRVLSLDFDAIKAKYEYRSLAGSLLVQEKNHALYSTLHTVSQKQALQEVDRLKVFGLKAIKHIKSNAIAIVRECKDGSLQLLGMGAGQPNRFVSVSLAIEKAKENIKASYTGPSELLEEQQKHVLSNALLISEAFFPFPDSVELCARYGIKHILQPGGSIKDRLVIEACDTHGISMVMTGTRHFKH